MGSLEKYQPNRGGSLSRRAGNALSAARSLAAPLWDGTFTSNGESFTPPTWEALPGPVRWRLAGQDTLPGPILGSFVRPPRVSRRGSSYHEVTSGWLLHETGVFLGYGERALRPLSRSRYTPHGDWTVRHQQIAGPDFRIRHGTFDAERSSGSTVPLGMAPQLSGVWSSLPSTVRSLLGSLKGDVNDEADWWVLADDLKVQMTLCHQRTSEHTIAAAHLTRSIPRVAASDQPLELARLLEQSPWSTHVFRARLKAATAAELQQKTKPALRRPAGDDPRPNF